MPTKFSEFFTLAPGADDLQQRVYNVISNATSIVDCYAKIYEYIVGGLRWASMKQRHDLMDNTVDISGLTQPQNQLQWDDAVQYFAGGDLAELDNLVLFEQLAMVPRDAATYGPNVFSLQFDSASTTQAQIAYRQVKLYLQVLIYNKEYDRQDEHHKKEPTTQALPNQKITINPAVPSERVNPDDPAQLQHLTNWVEALKTWIKSNYSLLQAVLNAGPNDLYPLIFISGHLSYDEKTDAIETMLDKIRCMGDSNPSTRKAFGLWVIKNLKDNAAFWNDAKISDQYADILKLEKQFTANATRNLEIYEYFKDLFTDFLNEGRFEGESEPQAQLRRATALGYIQVIFQNFYASQTNPIAATYQNMMAKALERIKSDYESLYTDNLLRASKAIPPNTDVRVILPDYLADLLKAKADECLRTLPLLQGKTEVRFFTIPNLEELEALNAKSVIVTKANQTRSIVNVPSDPSENGVDTYRPIYRSIRYSFTTDRYIAFCNLGNLAAGTFYYRHVQSPAVVDVPATNVFGRILTVDFQNYTINYPSKPDKTKNGNGVAYRAGGSTLTFFADLKNTTKWTMISGVRRYDPYYITNSFDASKPVGHLTGYVAAGRGATRTLPLDADNNLCVWMWMTGDFTRIIYPRLPEVVGLPLTRQIVPTGIGGRAQLRITNTPQTVLVGSDQCSYVNYGHVRFKPNGFFYHIIGITKPGEEEQFYVQVNTPRPSVAAILTGYKQTISRPGGRPMEADPRTILDRFNFGYFRRITAPKDAFSGKISFTENSKVYQLFRKGDKRKPTGSEVITWPGNEFDCVGTNLPICFNIAENIILYYMDKQTRGKIINKGNALYRERKPRKDAATAMGPIYRLMKSPSSTLSRTKVPATAFSDSVIAASDAVKKDWGTLKVASSNSLPVNQEWCHLRGHGDGGDEYPGNFVSGSLHCNTEQLAIETGQRLVTQQNPERSFVLHTTAYLLRDANDYKSSNDPDRESQILTGNYLDNQSTYQDMLRNNVARRSRELGIVSDDKSKKRKIELPKPQQGDVAPLAAYLRYKVMRSEESAQPAQAGQGGQGPPSKKRQRDETTEKRSKFFDFIFEGQSEFIDVHQFTIVSRAVQFALAGNTEFMTWYEQEKANLDANAS